MERKIETLAEDSIKIGVAGKPHGTQGEIEMRADGGFFAEDFDVEFVMARIDGGLVPLRVESWREKTETTALLQLHLTDSLAKAQRLTGCEIYVLRDSLEEGDEEDSNGDEADGGEEERRAAALIGYKAKDASTGLIGTIRPDRHKLSNLTRNEMKKSVIIVAGGSGLRMGSTTPKQFLPLSGKPVLMRTIERFAEAGMETIVVVLPESQTDYWEKLCEKYKFNIAHTVAYGGETRFHSVRNGLNAIAGEDDGIVGIHDGVRPLVSTDTIRRCYAEAEKYGSAIPVAVATESVRIVESNGTSWAIDRSTVRLVQTPQVFRSETIRRAYGQEFSPIFTDDASVAEANGNKMHLTQGNKENVKLTTPDDMLYAEAILGHKPQKQ